MTCCIGVMKWRYWRHKACVIGSHTQRDHGERRSLGSKKQNSTQRGKKKKTTHNFTTYPFGQDMSEISLSSTPGHHPNFVDIHQHRMLQEFINRQLSTCWIYSNLLFVKIKHVMSLSSFAFGNLNSGDFMSVLERIMSRSSKVNPCRRVQLVLSYLNGPLPWGQRSFMLTFTPKVTILACLWMPREHTNSALAPWGIQIRNLFRRAAAYYCF